MIGYIAPSKQRQGKKKHKNNRRRAPRPHYTDCVCISVCSRKSNVSSGGAEAQLGKKLRTKSQKQHGPGRKEGVGVKTTCINTLGNRRGNGKRGAKGTKGREKATKVEFFYRAPSALGSVK